MRIAPALTTCLLATACLAHDETPCTSEAEAKWQPLSAAVKKAESLGHQPKVAEIHHKCYEVRGKTKDGQRFELILNPVTLEPRPAK
ncbi:PepSY domain-containing protein [Chitinimonas koreensis]|uniref:PepSY domain-containing protein n=1 Tax=Chitinimonas koreensis TaxID=356302 RepID=UPI0003F58558|nr:PepSY domain-containing protein [Chitinimonas koreensis]QNM95812.1 PepSY domain-containing protein [Chitinimonas koreensis]